MSLCLPNIHSTGSCSTQPLSYQQPGSFGTLPQQALGALKRWEWSSTLFLLIHHPTHLYLAVDPHPQRWDVYLLALLFVHSPHTHRGVGSGGAQTAPHLCLALSEPLSLPSCAGSFPQQQGASLPSSPLIA